MNDKELLEQYKIAVKKAVDSSIPYIAKHNAFLISAESWEMLADLADPKVKALGDLFKRRDNGEKFTEEEAKEAIRKVFETEEEEHDTEEETGNSCQVSGSEGNRKSKHTEA